MMKFKTNKTSIKKPRNKKIKIEVKILTTKKIKL